MCKRVSEVEPVLLSARKASFLLGKKKKNEKKKKKKSETDESSSRQIQRYVIAGMDHLKLSVMKSIWTSNGKKKK